MSDSIPTSGGTPGITAECPCGAELPERQAPWGCTDCGGDCCPACGFWLESTVYCLECTDRLLAA